MYNILLGILSFLLSCCNKNILLYTVGKMSFYSQFSAVRPLAVLIPRAKKNHCSRSKFFSFFSSQHWLLSCLCINALHKSRKSFICSILHRSLCFLVHTNIFTFFFIIIIINVRNWLAVWVQQILPFYERILFKETGKVTKYHYSSKAMKYQKSE